jgi:hypothetical protein
MELAGIHKCDGCGVNGAGDGWWEVATDNRSLFVVYPVGKIPKLPGLAIAVRLHFCGKEHATGFLWEKMAP